MYRQKRLYQKQVRMHLLKLALHLKMRQGLGPRTGHYHCSLED